MQSILPAQTLEVPHYALTLLRARIVIYPPSRMVTWAEHPGNNTTSEVYGVPVGAHTGFGTLVHCSQIVIITGLQSGCLPPLKKLQLRKAGERPESGFEHRCCESETHLLSFLLVSLSGEGHICVQLTLACPQLHGFLGSGLPWTPNFKYWAMQTFKILGPFYCVAVPFGLTQV